MPTYSFRCSDCDHLFEKFFSKIPKDGEVLDVKCTSCKSKSVVRWFSGKGSDFVLRGSGWYRDGYGNKKQEHLNTLDAKGTNGDD
jgi:putative FmdB family regulatory protein